MREPRGLLPAPNSRPLKPSLPRFFPGGLTAPFPPRATSLYVFPSWARGKVTNTHACRACAKKRGRSAGSRRKQRGMRKWITQGSGPGRVSARGHPRRGGDKERESFIERKESLPHSSLRAGIRAGGGRPAGNEVEGTKLKGGSEGNRKRVGIAAQRAKKKEPRKAAGGIETYGGWLVKRG